MVVLVSLNGVGEHVLTGSSNNLSLGSCASSTLEGLLAVYLTGSFLGHSALVHGVSLSLLLTAAAGQLVVSIVNLHGVSKYVCAGSSNNLSLGSCTSSTLKGLLASVLAVGSLGDFACIPGMLSSVLCAALGADLLVAGTSLSPCTVSMLASDLQLCINQVELQGGSTVLEVHSLGDVELASRSISLDGDGEGQNHAVHGNSDVFLGVIVGKAADSQAVLLSEVLDACSTLLLQSITEGVLADGEVCTVAIGHVAHGSEFVGTADCNSNVNSITGNDYSFVCSNSDLGIVSSSKSSNCQDTDHQNTQSQCQNLLHDLTS